MYIYSTDVNTQRLRSSPPPTHKPTNVRQAAHHFTNVISLCTRKSHIRTNTQGVLIRPSTHTRTHLIITIIITIARPVPSVAAQSERPEIASRLLCKTSTPTIQLAAARALRGGSNWRVCVRDVCDVWGGVIAHTTAAAARIKDARHWVGYLIPAPRVTESDHSVCVRVCVYLIVSARPISAAVLQ